MKFVKIAAVLIGCLPALLHAVEPSTNSLQRIVAAEAKNHIGEKAIVKGTIAEVNRAERIVRLNFEQPFPKQRFTAVIFSSRTNLFQDLDKLKGQTVEVSGEITDYRDRPQIVLSATNQLKVLEPVSSPGSPRK